MTKKILLMSDIHITKPGVNIAGLDPLSRFKRCLEHASNHHSDASHLFLMGDLTHHGLYEEYKILKDALDNQPFKTTLMLGNHDRRTSFQKVFPNLPADFQHGSQNFGKTKILYLDTLDEGAKIEHSGFICKERMMWLKTNLLSAKGPVIILSHHHMFTTGLDGMDEIRLINGREVAKVIAASGRGKMVISGHVHRTIYTTYNGLAHATIQSPCHQMPLILGPGSSNLSVPEPGGYGVLLLDGESPILHHMTIDLPGSTDIHGYDSNCQNLS